MSTEPQISTSIVIYNEDPSLLKKRLNVVFDAKLMDILWLKRFVDINSLIECLKKRDAFKLKS